MRAPNTAAIQSTASGTAESGPRGARPRRTRDEAQSGGDGEPDRNHAHQRRNEREPLGERGRRPQSDGRREDERADRERSDGGAGRPPSPGRQARADPGSRGEQRGHEHQDHPGQQQLGRPQPHAIQPRVGPVDVLERFGRLDHAQPAVGHQSVPRDPGREQRVSGGGGRQRGGAEGHQSPGRSARGGGEDDDAGEADLRPRQQRREKADPGGEVRPGRPGLGGERERPGQGGDGQRRVEAEREEPASRPQEDRGGDRGRGREGGAPRRQHRAREPVERGHVQQRDERVERRSARAATAPPAPSVMAAR